MSILVELFIVFFKLGAFTIGGGIAMDAGNSLFPVISGSPVDIISVIILVATVILIAKYKKSPFIVLIIMGCIGAVLGV